MDREATQRDTGNQEKRMHDEKWIVKPLRETQEIRREECMMRNGSWSHSERHRKSGEKNAWWEMDREAIRETREEMREECVVTNGPWSHQTLEMMREEWMINRLEKQEKRRGKLYGTATNQTLIIQQIKAECMVNPTERHGKWWEKNGGQIDDRDKENDERPVEDKSMTETRKMMRDQ